MKKKRTQECKKNGSSKLRGRLAVDESEEAFTEKLKALMTVKPMTQTEVKKKAKRKK